MRYITDIYTYSYSPDGTQYIRKLYKTINVTENQVSDWIRMAQSEVFFRIDLSDGSYYEMPLKETYLSSLGKSAKFFKSITDVFGFVRGSKSAIFTVYSDIEYRLYNMFSHISMELDTDDLVEDAYHKFIDYNYNMTYGENTLIGCDIMNGVVILDHDFKDDNGANYTNFIWLLANMEDNKYRLKRLGAFDAYLSEEFDIKDAISIKDKNDTFTVTIICFKGCEYRHIFTVSSENYKKFRVLFSKYCMLK